MSEGSWQKVHTGKDSILFVAPRRRQIRSAEMNKGTG